jgi:arginine exporter protein ArgO
MQGVGSRGVGSKASLREVVGRGPGRSGSVSGVSSTAAALVAGLVAGYGIAMPLGAIGVLIVHEGVIRGWRSAAAAASGTALVDLGYVCLALAAGVAVTQRLQGWTRTIQLVGALVLVAVVIHGLLALRRTALPLGPSGAVDGTPSGGPVTDPAPGSATTDAASATTDTGSTTTDTGSATTDTGPVTPRSTATIDPVVTAGGPAVRRALRRFVALTAINPLTAVYFVVLTAGLGGTIRGTAAAAFAAGVFVASWSWQLLLAAIGTLAGARLPEWARTATSLAGYLVVLGYAVKLALG